MTSGKPIYLAPGILQNVQELQKEHFCLTLVPCREIIRLCTDFSLVRRDDFELFLSELADKLCNKE